MDQQKITSAMDFIRKQHGELPVPERCYIILMSHRSGSTLLCSHLEAIGYGRPLEGFSLNPERFARKHHWGEVDIIDPFAYIKKANETQTVQNVLGTKMNWIELQIFLKKAQSLLDGSGLDLNEAELLEVFYPNARYLLLLRKNKINQAVSYSTALQNGIWVVPKDQEDTYKKYLFPAVYDREHIEGCLDILLANDVAWQDFLRIHNIPHYVLWFEDLMGNYQIKMAEVHQFLGVDGSVSIPDPLLKKISNNKSRDWAADFKAETPWLSDPFFKRALESGDFQAALNRRSFLLLGKKERDRWEAMPINHHKKLRKLLWRVKRKTKEIFHLQ